MTRPLPNSDREPSSVSGAVVEGGTATATVTAETPVRAAGIPAELVDRSELEEIAKGHRREGE